MRICELENTRYISSTMTLRRHGKNQSLSISLLVTVRGGYHIW